MELDELTLFQNILIIIKRTDFPQCNSIWIPAIIIIVAISFEAAREQLLE
jgi:hypothetical protein